MPDLTLPIVKTLCRRSARPYPRVTTLDFLERCPERIADCYRYWNGKRGDRAMPGRADIDPVDIKHLLPGVLLVDVHDAAHRFTYRLAGTAEVEARGYDPTGRDVGSSFFGSSRDEVLINYRYVVAEKSFVYDEDSMVSPNQRVRENGTLLLPLSADGSSVNMVLVYAEYLRL
ncbi:MAG: PAS domain-containing protein [Dongiaceae bacterium]